MRSLTHGVRIIPGGCITPAGCITFPEGTHHSQKAQHLSVLGFLWWGRTDSIYIFAGGENKGIHQCLHWWKQHPTGVLLCYGFESARPIPIPQKRPVRWTGGMHRIRFAAAKPRRLQPATGRLPRAAFRIRPPNAHTTKKTSPLDWSFLWWGRTDSNHRSDTQQIYSLSPLATRELPHMKLVFCLNGAGRRTRTPDLLITNQLLYQLSYTGGSNRTRLL